jgi:hypothetical protein
MSGDGAYEKWLRRRIFYFGVRNLGTTGRMFRTNGFWSHESSFQCILRNRGVLGDLRNGPR